MTDAEEEADDQAGAPGKNLSFSERSQVRKAAKPGARVVYEIIRTEGESELRRPFSALWWSGVAAGISIGFSFLTEAALSAHLPASEWTPIIAKLGYAVGFLIVILGHQQLFTENVLTAVLPVISRRKPRWFFKMLRLWTTVLAANVVGCIVFAWFFAFVAMLGPAVQQGLTDIVQHLMANDPYQMFVKGIGAGWVIAALVWILAATKGEDFLIITLLTYLIALFGFTHIVAGTAEVAYGVMTGTVTLNNSIFQFFLPTLAGNVFGGTVLFSALSYAQVREEIFESDSD